MSFSLILSGAVLLAMNALPAGQPRLAQDIRHGENRVEPEAQ